MATGDDDVDKLLSQMRLQDFRYRAFESGERPPLRVVKPAAVGVPPAPPVAATLPAREIRTEAPNIAAKPSTPPPAAPARSNLAVSEAFNRIARRGMADSAPRLLLRLDLPLRPALPKSAVESVAVSDRPLADVFNRLDAAALSGEVAPASAKTGR